MDYEELLRFLFVLSANGNDTVTMQSQHSLNSDPPPSAAPNLPSPANGRGAGGEGGQNSSSGKAQSSIAKAGEGVRNRVKSPIRSGYDIVRILAAAVLLTAAGLKCHQLSTEPILAKTWLDARWLLMTAVEFELLFGIWLISNNLPRLTWLAALGCFSLFTCIALYKAWAGYGSCGCFGAIIVRPGATATLDAAFVLSLLIWRPRNLPSPGTDGTLVGRGVGGEGGENSSRSSKAPSLMNAWAGGEGGREHESLASGRGAGGEGGWHAVSLSGLFRRALLVLLAWLPLGLPAAYAMVSYTDTTLSDVGTIVGDGKIVVLEPERWLGKKFPLESQVDIGQQLMSGTWLVVVYKWSCTTCKEAIAAFTDIPITPTLAFIECPPYDLRDCRPACDHLVYGHLSDAKQWRVETPLILLIDDGYVQSLFAFPDDMDTVRAMWEVKETPSSERGRRLETNFE